MWFLWLLIFPGITVCSWPKYIVKCDVNQFQCNNMQSCFYKYQWCDRFYDCLDRTDESYCSYQSVCPPDFFRCHNGLCVPGNGRCDGYPSCTDGSDEFHCEKEVSGVNTSRILALNWLKNQRNAAWGWRDNTHRAITALYLAKGENFNSTDFDEDLMAKQLELRLSTAILRNETDLLSATQLAMYVNALLVICRDPRDFYGFNLVNDLKRQIEYSKNSTHLLPYLALCNAKETLTDVDIRKLVGVLECSSNHSFLTDVQSIALITLACVENSSKILKLKENITEVVNALKKRQNEIGSFGNVYTTALVVQAILSLGHKEDTDWDLKEAVEFLKTKQRKDGSFGDFLATYLILPILNSKSLADIGKINCTHNSQMPRDGNLVLDTEFKLGSKISIKYYLYVGDQKDQEHHLFLRVPANSSVLNMMRLASKVDPKYKFQTQNIRGKQYIYELFGITNDPEDEKFWLLFIKSKKSTLQLITKSSDEVYLKNNAKIIMWYKTAQINCHRNQIKSYYSKG